MCQAEWGASWMEVVEIAIHKLLESTQRLDCVMSNTFPSLRWASPKNRKSCLWTSAGLNRKRELANLTTLIQDEPHSAKMLSHQEIFSIEISMRKRQISICERDLWNMTAGTSIVERTLQKLVFHSDLSLGELTWIWREQKRWPNPCFFLRPGNLKAARILEWRLWVEIGILTG